MLNVVYSAIGTEGALVVAFNLDLTVVPEVPDLVGVLPRMDFKLCRCLP